MLTVGSECVTWNRATIHENVSKANFSVRNVVKHLDDSPHKVSKQSRITYFVASYGLVYRGKNDKYSFIMQTSSVQNMLNFGSWH